MSDKIFITTINRLRDLPGLPEESIQDVNALLNRYYEAKENELRRGVTQTLRLCRLAVSLGLPLPEPGAVFAELKHD